MLYIQKHIFCFSSLTQIPIYFNQYRISHMFLEKHFKVYYIHLTQKLNYLYKPYNVPFYVPTLDYITLLYKIINFNNIFQQYKL